ncbi:MAG: DUF2235 domain-containing protein [Candidatus Obscuribacterales bacterium]
MKRIVFCFDGTACALNASTPTNVVLTAASINRTAKDKTPQIIYYDEGVGTGTFDDQAKWTNKVVSEINKAVGGGIGWGLTENIREAYRFLIFNYDPGDEIFVFGFSRGAFTARSFIGLIRHVGPIRRLHASRIDEALNMYHKRVEDADRSSEDLRKFRANYSSDVCIDEHDEEWRIRNVPGYEKGTAPIIKIKYLGVWDTVSALGAPEIMPGSSRINVGYRFHDTSVTRFIDNARHAIAIDERRSLFPSVRFGDLTDLNKAKGFEADHVDAPYQERYFPGEHGSVGGGGDIRGLSDAALAWVLQGAKRAGLELDTASGTRIQSIAPNPLAPLNNIRNAKPDLLSITLYQLKRDRVGPDKLWQLSSSVLRRWKADASQLEEKILYRPTTLQKLKKELDEYVAPEVCETTEVLASHKVVPGDTLYSLAGRYYGDKTKFNRIFEANRDTMDDARELFNGTELRIPKLPET